MPLPWKVFVFCCFKFGVGLGWGSGRVTKEYMTKDEENLLQKIEVLENEIF